MSSSSESPGKSDGLVIHARQGRHGLLGLRELRTTQARSPGGRAAPGATRGQSPVTVPAATVCENSLSANKHEQGRGGGDTKQHAVGALLLEPAPPEVTVPAQTRPLPAWQGPGRPCPHHWALKIVFFWMPKGGRKPRENRLFGFVFSSSKKKKNAKNQEGKVQLVSSEQLRMSGGGSQTEDRGDRGPDRGRGEARQSAGVRPWRSGPHERERGAQGDGTLAAHGSETQRRRPWAAGSGRRGEAGKRKEVAVTPGSRGSRDAQAGPYLSRRQTRRRRRGSG